MRPKIRGNRGHVFLHNGRGIISGTWKDGAICATIAGKYSQEIMRNNSIVSLALEEGKEARRIFKAVKRCVNQDAREKRRRRRNR